MIDIQTPQKIIIKIRFIEISSHKGRSQAKLSCLSLNLEFLAMVYGTSKGVNGSLRIGAVEVQQPWLTQIESVPSA